MKEERKWTLVGGEFAGTSGPEMFLCLSVACQHVNMSTDIDCPAPYGIYPSLYVLLYLPSSL